MSIIQNLLKELTQESGVTRKMLERIPSDKYDWQPHEKSMPVKQLAAHIAELPGWISMAFTTDEMDFAVNAYQVPIWNNSSELLGIFEKSLTGAQIHLEKATEKDLLPDWILRNGDQLLMKQTKGELIRHSLNQIVHHRAQLGVYLRLLNVPIPGTYGPSADEQNF